MVLKQKIISRLKDKELISYLVFGVLTTVVNYMIYFSSTKIFHINYIIGNILAWFFSVIFAYITNKFFVFANKLIELKHLIKEIFLFISARLTSGAIETVFLILFVDLLSFEDDIIKIIASVFIVIFNYYLSKFIIFRKNTSIKIN